MDLLLPSFGLIFWTTLSFIIVLIILRVFAWKPILASLKEREHKITATIASAEILKKEMAAAKHENEKAMAEMAEQRKQIIAEAKETANKIILEAQEKAKTQANHILIEAQQEIQQQKITTLAAIKNEVVDMVVIIAEKVLEKELAHKKEQEQFIAQLSEKFTINSTK